MRVNELVDVYVYAFVTVNVNPHVNVHVYVHVNVQVYVCQWVTASVFVRMQWASMHVHQHVCKKRMGG